MAGIPISCQPAIFQGITNTISNTVISKGLMESPTPHCLKELPCVSLLHALRAKTSLPSRGTGAAQGTVVPSAARLPDPALTQETQRMCMLKITENSFFFQTKAVFLPHIPAPLWARKEQEGKVKNLRIHRNCHFRKNLKSDFKQNPTH